MRNGLAFLTTLLSSITLAAELPSAALGEGAPEFTLKDAEGDEVKLSHFKGNTIVLEWFNPECPFVGGAHEEGGALRELAARQLRAGGVWLAINSAAPGKEGSGAQRNREAAALYSMDYPILLDESGEVGRLYEARTTPQIVIIDPSGTLVYRGAPDDAPLGRGEGARRDYLSEALDALLAGRAPPLSETAPYGCGVRY